MQIDQLQVRLRARSSWEAIDLGVRMLQHWAKPIYKAWFSITLPIFIALNVLCLLPLGWLAPWLAAFIFWWLLPLFDRSLLQVQSQALFGQIPDVAATRKASLQLWRKQGLIALTWRRFMPARSFYLPVSQLEGLDGAPRKQRISTLAHRSDDASNAVWLTMTCVNLEFVLLAAFYALAAMLIPQGFNIDYGDWLMDETPSLFSELLSNLLYYLALSIIEPLYVACGFSLYLNRRSQLESWDIEIAFRNAVKRAERPATKQAPIKPKKKDFSNTPLASFLALALLAAALSGNSSPSYAQVKNDKSNRAEEVIDQAYDGVIDTVKESLDKVCVAYAENTERLQNSPVKVEKTLGEILEDPSYAPCEEKEVWLPKDAPDSGLDDDSVELDWLAGFGEGFAALIQMFLWTLLAAAALLLSYWLLYKRPEIELTTTARRKAQDVAQVFEQLSLDNSVLPEDVVTAAKTALDTGDKRLALSLLYRGALRHLIEYDDIDLSRSQTEGDCLRAAVPLLERQSAAQGRYFHTLTRAWQQIAYSLLPLDNREVAEIAANWPKNFGRQAHTPAERSDAAEAEV